MTLDFTYTFLADGFDSVWMGVLSVKILMFLKGETRAINCDLPIKCVAASSLGN